MKLVLFDEFKLGVLQGESIVDASAAVQGLGYHSPQEMMQMLTAQWTTLQPRVEEAIAGQSGIPLTQVRIRPPLPRPGQLVCLAGNYLEPQKPERGVFNAFLKSPNSVIGLNDTVELCPAEATVFHFEPELAVVIGKAASRLSATEAMDCVFGYTQFIDVSSRGLPGGFFLGKSWHTFGPMGPVLVTNNQLQN
jgi:2-keto-4-pentenoate hydratase/2-oxohepta-3-ene-1,7-dioic acid hydratase in catechol pathway